MEQPDESQCRVQPSAWFLLGTLTLTALATTMLCAAIMTDHWERLTWDHAVVDRVTLNVSAPRRNRAEWLVDGRVARIVFLQEGRSQESDRTTFRTVERSEMHLPAVFLVPMHGGIWTMCVSLTVEERRLLERVGFTQPECINYLSLDSNNVDEIRADWQHRMQNLSISCALVCLIILGAAALVGAFGVFTHQISAVLVTGVMYLLAATFAMFTLSIIHFKRQQGRTRPDLRSAECLGASDTATMLVDGVSASLGAVQTHVTLEAEYLAARVFSSGWSLDLGWGGVTLCVLTSVLWILLSKIMRYSPISTMVP